MKFLTDEDTIFKGVEHYTKLKKRFNKADLNDWYENIYRHPYSIGYVSELFKRLNPKTMEEAYDGYIVSGILDTELPKTKRGRTKEELEEMAIEWKDHAKSDIPLVDFYDALILHAVVETCLGMIMERQAEKMYQGAGFTIEETDGMDDRTLGIDFIARNGDKVFLVQVKPISFFRSDKPDLVSDRYAVWDKHKKGVEKYPNSSYAYMAYDPDGLWLCKGGRMNFRYGELIDQYGRPKVNIDSPEFLHVKVSV